MSGHTQQAPSKESQISTEQLAGLTAVSRKTSMALISKSNTKIMGR
jgi:hypothetical protein